MEKIIESPKYQDFLEYYREDNLRYLQNPIGQAVFYAEKNHLRDRDITREKLNDLVINILMQLEKRFYDSGLFFYQINHTPFECNDYGCFGNSYIEYILNLLWELEAYYEFYPLHHQKKGIFKRFSKKNNKDNQNDNILNYKDSLAKLKNFNIENATMQLIMNEIIRDIILRQLRVPSIPYILNYLETNYVPFLNRIGLQHLVPRLRYVIIYGVHKVALGECKEHIPDINEVPLYDDNTGEMFIINDDYFNKDLLLKK